MAHGSFFQSIIYHLDPHVSSFGIIYLMASLRKGPLTSSQPQTAQPHSALLHDEHSTSKRFSLTTDELKSLAAAVLYGPHRKIANFLCLFEAPRVENTNRSDLDRTHRSLRIFRNDLLQQGSFLPPVIF